MSFEPKKLDLVVLVSGRGSNLQAIIDARQRGRIHSRIKMVLSNKDHVPALERAHQAHIPTQLILSQGKGKEAFHDELLNAVAEQNPDLIVLAGFMRILSQSFIETFRDRIINIHPSLLPLFPGLHAIRQALEAGVKVTGCTVHFVDQGCDTGPIILQTPLTINDDDDEVSLAERLLPVEHATLITAIQLLEQNKVVLQGNKTLLRDHEKIL